MSTLLHPTTIESLLTKLGSIDGVRYTAIDQGQLDQYSDSETPRVPIACPALLIAITGEEITPIKDGARSILTLDVRLITDYSTIANYAAPKEHIQDAITPYSLIPEIVERVRQVNPQGVTYLGFSDGIRQRTLSEVRLRFSLHGVLHS